MVAARGQPQSPTGLSCAAAGYAIEEARPGIRLRGAVDVQDSPVAAGAQPKRHRHQDHSRRAQFRARSGSPRSLSGLLFGSCGLGLETVGAGACVQPMRVRFCALCQGAVLADAASQTWTTRDITRGSSLERRASGSGTFNECPLPK